MHFKRHLQKENKMTSILDIYDELPDREKEIINESIIFKIKESWKAEYVMDKLGV